MDKELKPCPFCKGKANVYRWERSLDFVDECDKYAARAFCYDCGAEGSVQSGESYNEAIAKATEVWNRRAGVAFNGEVMLMGDRVYLAGLGYFTKEATS